MKLGYIRVSTKEQNFDIQLKALMEAGIDEEHIYKEKESGKSMKDRSELQRLLEFIRKDDELIVYDLSRLGRNTKDVLLLLEELDQKGIKFVSLKEDLDYSKPTGKFFVSVLSSLNQLDREIRNEKTKEGLERAKARGVKLGRKPIDSQTLKEAMEYYKKGYTIPNIVKLTGISKTTLFKYLKLEEQTNRRIK